MSCVGVLHAKRRGCVDLCVCVRELSGGGGGGPGASAARCRAGRAGARAAPPRRGPTPGKRATTTIPAYNKQILLHIILILVHNYKT